MWFDNCAKYEKWTDNIQVLKTFINENEKNTHTQRNLDKNCHITLSHNETEEGLPKVVRKPRISLSSYTQELLGGNKHCQGYQ